MAAEGKGNRDAFGARETFDTGSGNAYIYKLSTLEKQGYSGIGRLPFSIKVLLESALRNCDGHLVTKADVEKLANYDPKNPAEVEIPFNPSRVLLQDFTGVPSVVDLAALRSAMARLGGDPNSINPKVPVNLVIDHSVQVDNYGAPDAFVKNAEIEFKRNRERYEFLRWGQQAFENFYVVPPARGIVHQVNLEYIATGVQRRPEEAGLDVIYPDSLVGTDSHTTMINGLGIAGWGVGGIEAEAVMLGQPIYMLMPEVVGFKLTGKLNDGVTATDMTLTIVEMLRAKGVVGKFVEFYGPGISEMSLPDRATIANMAPEYGATMGFFPADAESVDFLRRTGRPDELVETVERYLRLQGMYRTDDTPDPEFVSTLELDLSEVVPSMAGPKRPQDRVVLPDVRDLYNSAFSSPHGPKGFGKPAENRNNTSNYTAKDGSTVEMKNGHVCIAAITSCTNTSNPSVMIGAGLVAKKATELGMQVPDYVKTSLAPGSRVVTDYLDKAGLSPFLDKQGFSLVGYGCTTCIGNSGPLDSEVSDAIVEADLVVAGVLSGNRNFEGRIHALVQANFLASPPLVVAYALAGTVDIDLSSDVIGKDKNGNDVYLKDIWPSTQEIQDTINSVLTPDLFRKQYEGVETSNEDWNAIPVTEGALFDWQEKSTYVQEPPFFMGLTQEVPDIMTIEGASVLVKVANSVTTDHISPAGAIPKDSPTARYLNERGVTVKDFNSYGSRRGNHEVMMRGTFGNIRLRNQMAPGTEGGYTTYLPTGEVMSIFDASEKYIASGTPLIVLAGQEYGTGSSRDWAAKGTGLLGARAVIAESYERIHRSNLVGMGVLPLQYKDGDTADSLGFDGSESFDIPIDNNLKERQDVTVTATSKDGKKTIFTAHCRLDTPVEVDYYRHGGILNYVLRDFLNEQAVEA